MEGTHFILRLLAPSVAVVASKDADDVARANALPSFADLLRPFGERIAGKVQVRDSQLHAQLHELFTLRFVNLPLLDRFDPTGIHKVASDLVMSHPDARVLGGLGIRSKDDVRDVFGKATTLEASPWYIVYRDLFCRNLPVVEHETFNHPVACWYVTTTNNPDPIAALSALSAPSALPPVYERGYLDPNFLKHYLLLHDSSSQIPVDPDAILTQMKKTFGLSCHLIRLTPVPFNQSDPENPPRAVPDLWANTVAELSTLLSIPPSLVVSPSQPIPNASRASVESIASTGSNTTVAGPTGFLSDVSATAVAGSGGVAAPSVLSDGSTTADMESDLEVDEKPKLSLSVPPWGCGRYISEGDVNAFDSVVREFLVQGLVPFLERNMQHLNEQVASSRRGLTGRFFSASRKFLGASRQTSSLTSIQNPDGSTSSIYAYNTPEMLMRKLADYAFMLRDYKFALSVYDSVKKDFQADRMMRYYASAQEMSALCGLMADGLKGGVDSMLTALNAHVEAKSMHYGARAAMLFYEMLRHREQFKDAPAVLVRLTADDLDLRSALFLEQAGLSYLRTDPVMIRKFAFNFVLAGHRFSRCNQKEQAFRCYVTAMDVYHEHNWSLVEDHMHFTLGRLSYHLSDNRSAIEYFYRLLRSSRQSALQQSSYLKEFLQVYKTFSAQNPGLKMDSLPPLPIPALPNDTVKVAIVESHGGINQNFGPGAGGGLLGGEQQGEDDMWDEFETDLVEYGFSRGGSALQAGVMTGSGPYGSKKQKSSLLSSRDNGRTSCAVGEPVFVTFELANQMQITMQLNRLSIVCAYSSSTKDKDGNAGEETNAGLDGGGIGVDKLVYNAFDVEYIHEITLGALERRQMQIKVFPKQEGSLKVLGLRYYLCDTVPTFRPFNKRGKRLNATAEQRQMELYAADNSLNLIVTPPMPVLDLTFRDFPEFLWSGEVAKAVLEVRNRGNRAMKNLFVKMSHPSFFCFGGFESEGVPVYDHCEVDYQEGRVMETVRTDNILVNSSVIGLELPDKGGELPLLGAGSSMLLPVWIRGDRMGRHVFRFMFGYQSETAEKNNYRTLKISMGVQVLPSLRINAFTRPSTRSLDEFILGIEIENLQQSNVIRLKQISSLSPSWMLIPIDDELWRDSSQLHLPARQTLFMYFRFVRVIHPSEDISKCPESLTAEAVRKLIFREDLPPALPALPIDLQMACLANPDTLASSRPLSCSRVPFSNLTYNSRLQWRMATLATQYPMLLPEQLGQLFSLYFTDDVDLALHWDTDTAGKGVKTGHHYIIGINLALQSPLQLQRIVKMTTSAAARAGGGTEGGDGGAVGKQMFGKALFASTVREKKALINSLLKSRGKDNCPIRVVLRAKNLHSHDFQNEGACMLPVTVKLRNSSWMNNAEYTLEITPGTSLAAAGAEKPPTASDFYWLGQTLHVGQVGPEQEVELLLTACFPQAGVYDLNRWKLNVTLRENSQDGTVGVTNDTQGQKLSAYVQAPTLPHLVTILTTA
ncbi:ER-golgi trafficking TRAPP I complex 85 kDa subunit-domain-containing protein [Cladochytrium replicatum]|nr:ER-golgi trafficking TRAPP I complex 85 kDa subunit-domain-containing protein [Cladochytrium replicatum]